jgi:cobalt transporter subunit CbtA
MALFRTLVFVAAIAGTLAGLALTAIQHVSTVPLILKAERYENRATPADAAPTGEDRAAAATESWTPSDGLERAAYSALANIAGGIGFALLLVALGEIGGGIAGWRQGVFWGIGAFAAVTLAPSLGLPPALPAVPAGDLLARQIWWLATVACTGGGLALLFFRRSLAATVFGIALIVAPHVVGAPQPARFDSAVPHDIVQRYVSGAVVSAFVFWVLLGGLAGFVRARLASATN